MLTLMARHVIVYPYTYGQNRALNVTAQQSVNLDELIFTVVRISVN